MPRAKNNVPKNKTVAKKGLGIFLSLLLAFGAFLSGMQIGQSNFIVQGEDISREEQSANLFFSLFNRQSEAVKADTTRIDMSEFWRVWNILDDKFAVASSSGPTDKEKIQGAIKGLVKSFDDPYTVYFPPKEAENFDVNISGNFSGVGMEVGVRNNLITVIAPLPDTPAERAGVLPGDVIVKIDDESTDGMSLDDAVSLIRGEKGTAVVLQIYREGETEFKDISIIRDNIEIPTIKTEQEGDIFIIALYSFNAVAEDKVAEALKDYLQSGAEKLIIDLRGNPGGYLQGAVGIASYFLPAGKVIVKESFKDSKKDEVFRSFGRQVNNFNPKDLVVLVDNGSASAAEILAGALRDHSVATLIGTQTFGKGSVQELVELDDGSSLKVTIARWLTPNGASISKVGLTPDIVIGRTPQQRLAGEDPQKEAAIRFLHGEEVKGEQVLSVLELENKNNLPTTGE